NEIQTVDPTNKYHTYRLRYKVSQSYIVEVLSPDEAVVHFDQQPSNYGYASYTITYEGSRYDPATPIPIPLNTLHTAFDEGFVFIDHDAHDLQRIEVRISPSKVVAEDEDFLVIVIETYDIFGNPKPNI